MVRTRWAPRCHATESVDRRRVAAQPGFSPNVSVRPPSRSTHTPAPHTPAPKFPSNETITRSSSNPLPHTQTRATLTCSTAGFCGEQQEFGWTLSSCKAHCLQVFKLVRLVRFQHSHLHMATWGYRLGHGQSRRLRSSEFSLQLKRARSYVDLVDLGCGWPSGLP